LGLAFLAAVLEEAQFEVRILDFVVQPYSREGLEAVLSDFQPALVGLTAVTMTFHSAREVLADLKQIDPTLPAVMGGPHVTFCARQTLEEVPELDFIVLGEGEATLVALARSIAQGGGGEGIPGLAGRSGGEIFCASHGPAPLDVDRLPVPARHLLPLGRYRTLNVAVSMTTSRGCPHRCIFCVGRKMVGARVRYRSPIKVVDELAGLSAMGFAQVNIADDLFTANARHCMAICDLILARDLQVRWTSFARVDTVNVPLLERMKAAGCTGVCFGVESGSPAILKTIRKGITPQQVVSAVEMCNTAGVPPFASFILGLPGETPQTMAETVAFGERLREMGVSYGFHVLAPFPGTEVRENVARYDLRILSDDWREYHANRAVAETAEVSRTILDGFLGDWEKRYQVWLGELKGRLERGEADEAEAWPLRNLERVDLLYRLMMERALERHGTWQNGGRPLDEAQALAALCKRIGEQPGFRDKPLAAVLKEARSSGGLLLEQRDGRVRWSWLDYL